MFFRTAVAVATLWSAPAHALTLSLQSSSTPWPGVTVEHYSTTSPTTNTWVARVDLCEAGIRVEATEAPSGLQTVSSWASDAGVQLAVNADFYRSSPLRVYGTAVGDGVPWPLEQTGDDPAISWEWYFGKYGWLAFSHDEVLYTHTELVKNDGLVSGGWEPGLVQPDLPLGAISLVSGFPELVTEGAVVTCVSPTDPSCFPDRTDMRDRHPRTAMGITSDHQTLILAVVDGRTAISSGMYGAELADLMGQLGAWQAFNLDGGGSSQMWQSGPGTINDASGNNGGGLRSVANHLGIRAGGPERPSHCPTEPACELLPPTGGTVDNDSSCFHAFGPDQWWRDESAGEGGHLLWTNAFSADLPSNWAWWRTDLEQAGNYEVEVYLDPAFAVYDAVRYDVVAAGEAWEVVVDQSAASGWTSLGSFDFDAGGAQWVAVYDNYSGAVPGDQHIAVDAIRLTNTDPSVGTGTATGTATGTGTGGGSGTGGGTGSGTGGTPSDSGQPGSSPRAIPADSGCGCHTGSAPAGWLAALFALAGIRRRRPTE